MEKRTGPYKKALQIAKLLRHEHPDYGYLKTVFQQLRKVLDIEVTKAPKKLPYVPTEAELKTYYEAIWNAQNMQDMIIVKTLLYTGIRVSELIRLKIQEVDLDQCQLRIVLGKGKKRPQSSVSKKFSGNTSFTPFKCT